MTNCGWGSQTQSLWKNDKKNHSTEKSKIQWKDKLQYVPHYWEQEKKKACTKYSTPKNIEHISTTEDLHNVFLTAILHIRTFPSWYIFPHIEGKPKLSKIIKLCLKIKATRTVTVVLSLQPASNRFFPSPLVLLEWFHFLVKLDIHFWKSRLCLI